MTELNWTELWDETEKRYRVQTRDGRKVRIWTTSALSQTRGPIWGEISHNGYFHGRDETWLVQSWHADGGVFPRGGDSTADDLIPELRTVRRWVNVYRTPRGNEHPGPWLYKTKEEADKFCKRANHLATVPIDWEEQ